MNTTKYVMAIAGMRNSAGEAISVVAGSLLMAGVVLLAQRFEVFSSSVLLSGNHSAVIFTVGMFLVFIIKSLAIYCRAFSRSINNL